MALLLISFEPSYGYVNIDILLSLIIWCFLMISSRSCGRTVGVLCWLISLKLVGRISERLSLALIDVDHFEPIGNLLHMLSLMTCMLSWREEIAFSWCTRLSPGAVDDLFTGKMEISFRRDLILVVTHTRQVKETIFPWARSKKRSPFLLVRNSRKSIE